ncbi:hypothetical protein [Roseibacillus ishigakijimensis]|uniref:Uncharacterized protein n=1 Tax=Roseibacillus ishigakijimensis TaxID=454146 RepID=A0A934VLT2_9BACT|nr:hypothetical protein [Roseibacillus ishigakijimensis]MBK1835009.1 hypothetical protein [Roseibacillus ishigakijimensis]
MSKRLAIRNKVLELVESLAGFSPGNVALYKLDTVERTPFASVYLNETETDNLHMMRGMATMERTLSINVDFHLDSATDADAEADALLEELEQRILKAAMAGDIPGVRILFLASAEFRPTQHGKQRAGDLVTTWRAEYEDSISLSD